MKCNPVNMNILFKASISDKDIDGFANAKQHFCDCYLMSSLETLSHTPNGREILKNQIQYDDNNLKQINCCLYNEDGEKEIYSVPTDRVLSEYSQLYDKQENDIIRTVDISVDEYEKKHQSKPWFCRVGDMFKKKYAFEYNSPSNFMRMLTGVEPRTIAEKDLNLDLDGYKAEVMELFAKMDKEKEYSFVIGTGMKMLDGRTWHVYILENVDLKNGTITVKEKRGNNPRTMSIDTALSTFKYITGYFNSDLKQKVLINKT